MGNWHKHFTVMKNYVWMALLDQERDPKHELWLQANQLPGNHNRINARRAEKLHMLRLCRLPVFRYPAQATMENSVLVEAQFDLMNFIREWAHAIWRFEALWARTHKSSRTTGTCSNSLRLLLLYTIQVQVLT